jgi:hypothetical protein
VRTVAKLPAIVLDAVKTVALHSTPETPVAAITVR